MTPDNKGEACEVDTSIAPSHQWSSLAVVDAADASKTDTTVADVAVNGAKRNNVSDRGHPRRVYLSSRHFCFHVALVLQANAGWTGKTS